MTISADGHLMSRFGSDPNFDIALDAAEWGR